MKRLVEIYKEFWGDLTPLGKCTIFPIMCIGLPLIAILELGFKANKK